jgi:hypothetical protein
MMLNQTIIVMRTCDLNAADFISRAMGAFVKGALNQLLGLVMR